MGWPQGLERRRNVYWIRVRIPEKLQGAYGKTGKMALHHSLRTRLISVKARSRLIIEREPAMRAAGDDRGWHLLFLLSRLERLNGWRLQRIGLTATVGTPAELLSWLTLVGKGQVFGPTKPAADGDVTADYVGSVGNAVTYPGSTAENAVSLSVEKDRIQQQR